MKWITRKNVKVDRVACPWLIKKFIDPDAEFLFAEEKDIPRLAEELDATPFDVPHNPAIKLNHRAGKCTFEAIIDDYQLKAPALDKLAKIVHGADIASDISITAESAGLKAIAEGFLIICRDDNERLAKQFPIYDALYSYVHKHS